MTRSPGRRTRRGAKRAVFEWLTAGNLSSKARETKTEFKLPARSCARGAFIRPYCFTAGPDDRSNEAPWMPAAFANLPAKRARQPGCQCPRRDCGLRLVLNRFRARPRSNPNTVHRHYLCFSTRSDAQVFPPVGQHLVTPPLAIEFLVLPTKLRFQFRGLTRGSRQMQPRDLRQQVAPFHEQNVQSFAAEINASSQWAGRPYSNRTPPNPTKRVVAPSASPMSLRLRSAISSLRPSSNSAKSSWRNCAFSSAISRSALVRLSRESLVLRCRRFTMRPMQSGALLASTDVVWYEPLGPYRARAGAA